MRLALRLPARLDRLRSQSESSSFGREGSSDDDIAAEDNFLSGSSLCYLFGNRMERVHLTSSSLHDSMACPTPIGHAIMRKTL